MATITGYSIPSGSCPDVTPGIEAIKIIPRADIASATEASDEISAFTLEAAKFWKTYDLSEIGQAGVEVSQVEGRKKLYNATATIDFFGEFTEIKTAIEELADCSCGLVLAVRLTGGVIKVYGFDEDNGVLEALRLTGDVENTGKEEGDSRMSTITMTGRQTERSKIFSGAWTDLSLS